MSRKGIPHIWPIDREHHDDPELFQALRAVRVEREWTQELLAEKMGIGIRHLSRLETGHISPNLAIMLKWVYALEVNIAWVITGSNGEQKMVITDCELFR